MNPRREGTLILRFLVLLIIVMVIAVLNYEGGWLPDSDGASIWRVLQEYLDIWITWSW